MMSARYWEAVELCQAGALPISRKVLAAPRGHFPQLNTHTGEYRIEEGYLPGRGFRWAGYLAGRLWLLYDLTGNLLLRDAAIRLATEIAEGIEASRPIDRGNCGFDVYCALSLGAEITGDDALRALALRASSSMDDLFEPAAGLFRQNAWMDAVVSETPTCVLPLLWAARHGQGSTDRVRGHAQKTLNNGMLREDGSCQHRLFFGANGEIDRVDTSQGYAPDSTWARAQAWLLYSLVACGESFDDDVVTEALSRATTWYIDHMPDDAILYYDFDDPRKGEIPRDSCGTIIAAISLRRAAKLGIETQRGPALAEACENAILEDYIGPGGVVLHGSWGVGEGKSRWDTLFPRQDVMPYGNYYFVEMLHRLLQPASGIFSLRA